MIRSTVWVLCTALAFLVPAANAGIMVFEFTQVGWTTQGSPGTPTGGRIAGSFSGEDQNSDGFIDLESGEVASYFVSFSGSSFTPDFIHTLANLSFFRFSIGSEGFPPSFPLFSSGGGIAYDGDDGVLSGPQGCSGQTCLHAESTSAPALITVAQVPEPSMLALMSVVAFAFFRRCPRPCGRRA